MAVSGHFTKSIERQDGQKTADFGDTYGGFIYYFTKV